MKTKRCTKCGEIKTYDMFHRDKHKKDGYSPRCKVCEKEYRKVNRKKLKSYHREYYILNKEKILAYSKKRCKVYYQNNKHYFREKSRQRKLRQIKAVPKFLLKCETERQRLRDIYKLREVISLATGIEHHVDHMWPLSDGGPHWSGNLQIIPAKENLTKGTSVCKVTKKNIRDNLRIARKEYENSSNGH